MSTSVKYLLVFAVLLLPSSVFAQATLTGTVRDASGGILPGVTVEATSPVLIEKVRTAVTDDTGQYRIVDLRPGTYTVTYTLPGFTTVKRDGVQLAGTQVVTIPIELTVGGVQETITVTGDTPVVDVQTARREVVLDSEAIQRIPAARAAGALLTATPGVSVDNNGVALSPTMTFFNARSTAQVNSTFVAGEGRMAVSGYTVSAARSGGVSSYVYDTPNAEEVSVVVGGGLGESDIGGPVMNIIPRSGGNTFRGSAFVNSAGKWSRKPGHRARTRFQRFDGRTDPAGPSVVLRQLSRVEHTDGGRGHYGQCERGRPDALGLGRLRDRCAPGAGPADADRSYHRAVR
jgi:hypothetical protein